MAGMAASAMAATGKIAGAGEGAAEEAKFCSIDNPDCEACQ
jgi:ribonucleoside-diphosphate reductase alpha chain